MPGMSVRPLPSFLKSSFSGRLSFRFSSFSTLPLSSISNASNRSTLPLSFRVKPLTLSTSPLADADMGNAMVTRAGNHRQDFFILENSLFEHAPGSCAVQALPQRKQPVSGLHVSLRSGIVPLEMF